MQLIFYGLLIGWGAAIPFGPINLEMMRRNLHYGTKQGIAIGLGACLADIAYLFLLGLGAFTLMRHPEILRALGIIGSLILAWFGIKALNIKNPKEKATTKPLSFAKDLLAGFLMTLFNPYNVIFWSSLVAQVALISKAEGHALIKAGTGVLIGTASWVFFLNFLLHFTRHRLPQKVTQSLNFSGGIILLGFALFGMMKAFEFF